jgi:hypothetical protein
VEWIWKTFRLSSLISTTAKDEQVSMNSIDHTAATNIQAAADDADIIEVAAYIRKLDPLGERFALVLRNTIDQLLDGENTGRYDWNTLHKTEKTHAGTLVEINLQREFGFSDGKDMDFLIQEVEVDCKYSQKPFGWMIPPEALDEICLVVWADDHKGEWSVGLMRADREKLTTSNKVTKKGNRDGKYRLTKEHQPLVYWLWENERLHENLLLHLDPATRQTILSAGSHSSRGPGQAKVNELFRRVQQHPISRTVVRTVAQQKDYMKRVRYDGGARSKLRSEGILIFGTSSSHKSAAADLGVPVPEQGGFVSVRVVEEKPHHQNQPRTLIDGRYWVVASPDEPPESAPLLPT